MLAEVTPKKRTVALREADAPRRRDASEAKPRPVTVAILPAHNEEEIISTAVRALMDQTAPPYRVIVASDNSTDSTVERGRAAGAAVLETVGNDDKKAGALNQIFDRLLPTLDDDDVVLVQDADRASSTRTSWKRRSPYLDRRLRRRRRHLPGRTGGGFVGHLQRNEDPRYARDVDRLDGKCLVITGTAALFRVRTLREISAARLSGKLPPGNGRGRCLRHHCAHRGQRADLCPSPPRTTASSPPARGARW